MGRRGFGAVRKLPSGRWQAKYGDPRVKAPQRAPYICAPSTFATKAEANAWLAQVQADIASGTWRHPDDIAAEADAQRRADAEAATTFATYATQWLTTRPLKKSTHDAYRSYLDHHLIPRWGDIPVRNITTPAIRAWLATELAPERPGARRRAFELFRTVLNSAVDDGLIESSPVKRHMLGSAPRPGETSQRHEPRALSPAEVQALADEVPGYMRTAVLLAAVTGMRSGELRELRWKDVDLDAGTIRVERNVTGSGKNLTVTTPKSKAGRRAVRLSTDTVALLRAHRAAAPVRGGEGLLFPASDGSGKHLPAKTWQVNIARACERAGISHASPHDFRHTAASLAGRVPGVSLRDVQASLGQDSPGVIGRYLHTNDEQQTRIADALAREILNGAKTSVVNIESRRTA